MDCFYAVFVLPRAVRPLVSLYGRQLWNKTKSIIVQFRLFLTIQRKYKHRLSFFSFSKFTSRNYVLFPTIELSVMSLYLTKKNKQV